jgi:hypothetical protein
VRRSAEECSEGVCTGKKSPGRVPRSAVEVCRVPRSAVGVCRVPRSAVGVCTGPLRVYA